MFPENLEFNPDPAEREVQILQETLKRRPKAFSRFCANLMDNEIGRETIIGEGNAAKVFFIGHNPSFCVKVIKPSNLNLTRTSVKSEFNMQIEASRIGEINVPKPILAIYQSKTFDTELILMKRVFGLSIRQIIEDEKPLPANFDLKKFFKELEEQIEELHKYRIHHRDLHWGNVMIDEMTNQPWIIDFGSSTKDYFGGDEKEIYQETGPGGDIFKLPIDINSIRELRRKLSEHLIKS